MFGQATDISCDARWLVGSTVALEATANVGDEGACCAGGVVVATTSLTDSSGPIDRVSVDYTHILRLKAE